MAWIAHTRGTNTWTQRRAGETFSTSFPCGGNGQWFTAGRRYAEHAFGFGTLNGFVEKARRRVIVFAPWAVLRQK